jgi:hypothetical protein
VTAGVPDAYRKIQAGQHDRAPGGEELCSLEALGEVRVGVEQPDGGAPPWTASVRDASELSRPLDADGALVKRPTVGSRPSDGIAAGA